MAKAQADIEIAVRGINQLKEARTTTQQLTKEINRDLESELENDLRINNYSEIQDNGEEIKPSSPYTSSTLAKVSKLLDCISPK